MWIMAGKSDAFIVNNQHVIMYWMHFSAAIDLFFLEKARLLKKRV